MHRPQRSLPGFGGAFAISILAAAAYRLLRAVPAYPCNGITVKPPRTDPEPVVGGEVTDAGSDNSPIENAVMRLYMCNLATPTPTLVATTETDNEGLYSFPDLTPENWYYVEAVMSGPLASMTPASGTENPSIAVGLGDSVTDLDFAFE